MGNDREDSLIYVIGLVRSLPTWMFAR